MGPQHMDILQSAKMAKSIAPTNCKQLIVANYWCLAIASSYKPIKLHLIDKREAILQLHWAQFMPSLQICLPH